MLRIAATLLTTGLILSTFDDASAGRCRQSFRGERRVERRAARASRFPAPTSCSPDTGCTPLSTAGEPTARSEAKASPPPVTAEEEAWYDELLKLGIIDADYEIHWKNDSHAERKAFYGKMKAILVKDTGLSNGESTSSSQAKTSPSPVTAEEQAWYDELLKLGIIDADYELHWKNDSHAERKAFYGKMKAILDQGSDENGTGVTVGEK